MRPFTVFSACPRCEILAHHLLDKPREVTVEAPGYEVQAWGNPVPVREDVDTITTAVLVKRTCQSCDHRWDEEKTP